MPNVPWMAGLKPVDGSLHNARVIRMLKDLDITVTRNDQQLYFYSTLYIMSAKIAKVPYY